MPTLSGNPEPPRGIRRLLFRLPIWLYRLHLGWLLGGRFLLLNHVGRKSGALHQTVVEVADYDAAHDVYFVASGWGKKADWYRNLLKTPDITVQVGARKLAVHAEPLTPAASGQAMVDYGHRHPQLAQELARVIGVRVDGSDDKYRSLGEDTIRFVALRPRADARSTAGAAQKIAQ